MVSTKTDQDVLTVENVQKAHLDLGGLFGLVGYAGTISVQTPQPTAEELGVVDITEAVRSFVNRAGVNLGTVVLYSKHTTCTLVINEQETLLMKDVALFLNRLAPRDGFYLHNQFDIRTENMNADESPNGHAHCLGWLLGNHKIVPVLGGALQLGTWQRIFIVELDSARPREIIVMVLGAGNPREGPTS